MLVAVLAAAAALVLVAVVDKALINNYTCD
jgi:hypothetical protein